MASKEQKESRYSDLFFPHCNEFLAPAAYFFHVSKTSFSSFRLLQGEAGPVGSRGEMGGPGVKVKS